MKQMNLVGNLYGSLAVISYSHKTTSNGMSHYLCKCSCGNEKIVSHGNLRSGHTTSCGCKTRRTGKDVSSFVHGFSKNSKVYKSWLKIKERCYSENSQSYPHYSLKGVTMSESFTDNFLAFYDEVGDPPENSPAWTVDRIDNTLGYIEGNLRWANKTQQARNKGKYASNSSGETGINFYHSGNPKHATYAVSQWKDIDGKPQNKKFSIHKLGLLPAFKEAVEHRRKMIELLNSQGAGYTENHGK